jgi:hypothetical protein
MRPFALLLCTAFLVAPAGGAAHAAKPSQAVFRVSLTATLTKDWTLTRVEPEVDCTKTTDWVGRWQTRLSTRRPGRVTAVAAGGGRVRFTGAILRAIAGTANQSGTMVVTTRGVPPCNRLARSVRCDEQRRSFRGAFVSFASPRRGAIRLGALRGAGAIRAFNSVCEPVDARSIRTDLPSATGSFAAADVFARGVRRWTVRGAGDGATTIEDGLQGRVAERVRWTLTFTRL